MDSVIALQDGLVAQFPNTRPVVMPKQFSKFNDVRELVVGDAHREVAGRVLAEEVNEFHCTRRRKLILSAACVACVGQLCVRAVACAHFCPRSMKKSCNCVAVFLTV